MVEAKLNRDFALRVTLVGIMLLAISVWSVWDGRRAWPAQNVALEMVSPALCATNLTAEAWIRRDDDGIMPLDRIFQAKGLKTPSRLVTHLAELSLPERMASDTSARENQQQQVKMAFGNPVYSDRELRMQGWQAAVTFLLALWAFLTVLVKVHKRYRADERGLSGSAFNTHGTIPYDQLQSIDWSRWVSKGIAILLLKDGRRFTLDAWHFAGIGGIMEAVRTARPDLAGPVEKKA